MLDFLKNYYVFMLILLVFSYLVPKEEYRTYVQFFVGIFIVVLFLEPLLEVFTWENPQYVYEVFEKLNGQIKEYEGSVMEGESIFEYFFLEGKGK